MNNWLDAKFVKVSCLTHWSSSSTWF